MALNPADWTALAAMISAMMDVIRTGSETYQAFFEARRSDDDAMKKGEALRLALNTYSDAEMISIQSRIETCRNTYIVEPVGEERQACLCQVLNDVKAGNGGTLPDYEWAAMHKKLGC